jgi:hypothetical protein
VIAFLLYRGRFELAFLHLGHVVGGDGRGGVLISDGRGNVVKHARMWDLLVRLPGTWDGTSYVRVPREAALLIALLSVPFWGVVKALVGIVALVWFSEAFAHWVRRTRSASRAGE